MPSGKLEIRAVVFDVGGVLLDWNPRHLYRKLLPDEEAVERFLAEIDFYGWNLEQDRGRPFAEAVAERSALFPHRADLIRAYWERWEESIAGPIRPTVDLLAALKGAGRPLYVLSNWSSETFRRVRGRYPFLGWFDDIVVSGDVGLVKPDPRIFEVLLERIGRPASECLFIDDSGANVDAARALGFQAVRFESGERLASELTRFGLV